MSQLCLDLCSGLGGFSRSFVDAGWEVITVDLEPKFQPTIVADILLIDWKEFKEKVLGGRTLDVLLASPDCRYFSHANPVWPRPGVGKAMALVGACFEAVAVLKPKGWLIENPRCRLRGLIGKPAQSIRYSDWDRDFPTQKPTDLWGNIVLPLAPEIRRPSSSRNQKAFDKALPHHKLAQGGPFESAHRSEIPYGVSRAVREAVES